MLLFFISKSRGFIALFAELKIVRCKCGPVVFPFLTPLDRIVGPTFPINVLDETLSPTSTKKVSSRCPYKDFIPFECAIITVFPYPL